MNSKTAYAAVCEIEAEASNSTAIADDAVLEQIERQLRDCEEPDLEQRLRERRERAIQDRNGEREAARYMREKAESALQVFGQVPTSHGEVHEHDGSVAQRTSSTIRHPDQVALDASADRKRLLVGKPIEDVVALGLDVAASVGARNAVEVMLAHEAAALHRAAMQSLEDGLKQTDPVHKTRLLNTAARCMTAVQTAALTLQRLQQGVRQDVHVRHVHVHEGGQAAIGNFQTGGPRRTLGEEEK